MDTKTARVTNIPTKNIQPNPHNPRRLFDPGPLEILEKSIKKLGILVPLDVYPKDSKELDPKKGTFVLLDGERRWRCAKHIDLDEVPCIVIEAPSTEQNILTMFHIHNLREGWQLMPTALQLKQLMKILKTQNERELAELTKLSISQVRRCKVLLTYPKRHQNMMLAPVSERFKADFFVDLHRIRGPALANRFPPWVKRGDSRCIDIMVNKYESGAIKAVTEFRLLAAIYRAAFEQGRQREFMTQLEKLLSNETMRIQDVEIRGASYALEIREIGRSTRRLIGQLNDIDLENLSSDEGLILALKELANNIQTKLEQALLYAPREVQER